MLFKRTVISAALLLTISTSGYSQSVEFGDPNLKAAVEETLGVSDPTSADMEKLTVLSAVSLGITSAKGLEYAVNLEEVELDFNRIQDLAPLAELQNLKKLWMCDNDLVDISAVSRITSLERVQMENNLLSDVSAFAGLTNLIELELDHNQISDISALSGLRNIEILELENNRISDLSPILEMSKMSLLNVRDNPVENYEVAVKLPMLQYYWIGESSVIEKLQPMFSERSNFIIR
ncbi:leucine-rich repeat domain-containing protein [Pararhizobium sp. IMCC21322]|uniref:leucine-rich repeat domain-containing protein n=1 Tax=Pararhizobium sp. IMCC21322 TaxID=3067903 RepID=UPI00274075E8|nr:leucine-rich repeat domain-containing protein [Pararhizobium sp. IMCC21322]